MIDRVPRDQRRALCMEPCEVRLFLTSLPNDPAQLLDGVAFAHQMGLRGQSQTVAVIDTGVAYDHPALGGGIGTDYRIVGGWDFTEENDGDPFDDPPGGYHGTHVAGIIAGDDEDFLGVAPSVDLVALRVFNDQGISDFDWVESALQWVIEHQTHFENPITAVNLSLGTAWQGQDVPEWAILEDELQELARRDIFVTVAAGNNFQAQPTVGLNYPATSPNVVAVGSHDDNGIFSPFSRRGQQILVAPGENVNSTSPDYLYDFNGITDDYLPLSGSSMAAPFVAAASVLVRQALERYGNNSHATAAEIETILRDTSDSKYDPVTKAHYSHMNLRAALESIIPDGAQPIAVDTVEPLGTIEGGQATYTFEPDTTYELTAVRSGILSFTLPSSSDQSDILWHVTDEDGKRLDDVNVSEALGRIDVTVDAATPVRVRVTGLSDHFEVLATNLVTPRRNAIYVFGTPNRDEIFVSLQTDVAEINGVTYSFVGFEQPALRVNGMAGHDTIRAYLTSSSESVAMRPGSLSVQQSRRELEAQAVERINVYAAGGNDVLRIADSVFDDSVTISAAYTVASATSYVNYAAGFEHVRVHAFEGGIDSIRFVDTSGDDQFTSLERYSTLKGLGLEAYATGFDSIRFDAVRGGQDRATLYDSSSDDLFVGVPEYGVLTTPDRKVMVNGAAEVRVHAQYGGLDVAKLYDSPNNDRFYGLPDYAELSGVGFRHYVRAFESVRAYANRGGTDRADFFDSQGDDQFFGLPTYAVFVGDTFDNYAANFESVRAYSRSGSDIARLYGSDEDDSFTGVAEYSLLESLGYHHYVAGFASVIADVTQGGLDVARVVDSVEDDQLWSTSAQSILRNERYRQDLRGFDSVQVKSVRGGRDTAFLSGEATDRVFRAGSVFVGLQFLDAPATTSLHRESIGHAMNGTGHWTDFHSEYESTIDDLLRASHVGDHLVAISEFELVDLFVR